MWIDERTRSMTIQFLVYNGNYALFDIVQLDFRIELGGQLDKKMTMNTVDLELLNSAQVPHCYMTWN